MTVAKIALQQGKKEEIYEPGIVDIKKIQENNKTKENCEC